MRTEIDQREDRIGQSNRFEARYAYIYANAGTDFVLEVGSRAYLSTHTLENVTWKILLV